MKNHFVIPLLLLLATRSPAESAPVTNPVVAAESGFPSGVVARVNQMEVPYDWFLHEFRSTFYQHPGADDVRQRVMDGLLDRVLLYQAALSSGITNDARARTDIEERLRNLEAFMRYQMDMARLGFTIEAYLEKNPPAGELTLSEKTVREFYQREIAGQPGAPARFEDVPAPLQAQIREQAADQRRQTLLQTLIEGLKSNTVIEVNQRLMEGVPLPKMEGDVPPPFQGR